MATVRFTSALERFLAAPPADVAGATVGEALAAVFEARPALRGYVLDDQGALRRHVAVYIDGEAVRDRVKLSDPIGPDDDIYVFQALTGGYGRQEWQSGSMSEPAKDCSNSRAAMVHGTSSRRISSAIR